MTNQLIFNQTQFNIVERDNKIWLTSSQIAEAIGYKSSKSINNLYSRNSDEFPSDMTTVINSMTVRKTGNIEMDTRIFSLRGAHLIAMFARTPTAKEFRKWVLDILDKETAEPVITPINIDLSRYHFPLETASPSDRQFQNAVMTPERLLNNRAPELELLNLLEGDGYNVDGVRVRIESLHRLAEFQQFYHEMFSELHQKLDGVTELVKKQKESVWGKNVTFIKSSR